LEHCGSHVDNLGLGETGPRRNGRMEQNFPVTTIFRNILGQAREVHLKFRNAIPDFVLSIRYSPGISGIFGRMENALGLQRTSLDHP